MEIPKTRYVRTADGVYPAYQVNGTGDIDLLCVPPALPPGGEGRGSTLPREPSSGSPAERGR